jgi:hypothetical protein
VVAAMSAMVTQLIRMPAVLLAVAVLAVVPGCASTETYNAPVSMAHSGLLFDHHPGYPPADMMIRAGDWPSTESRYQVPEVIFYRETVHDVQGYGRHMGGHGIRRFDMYREGAATR